MISMCSSFFFLFLFFTRVDLDSKNFIITFLRYSILIDPSSSFAVSPLKEDMDVLDEERGKPSELFKFGFGDLGESNVTGC